MFTHTQTQKSPSNIAGIKYDDLPLNTARHFDNEGTPRRAPHRPMVSVISDANSFATLSIGAFMNQAHHEEIFASEMIETIGRWGAPRKFYKNISKKDKPQTNVPPNHILGVEKGEN